MREQRGLYGGQHAPRRPERSDAFEDEEDDAIYEVRAPTSTRRYSPTQASPRTVMRVQHHHAVPPRATRTQDYLPPHTDTASTLSAGSRPQPHWPLWGGPHPAVHALWVVAALSALALVASDAGRLALRQTTHLPDRCTRRA
ncbi:MAG: hypothetical protein JO202_17240 [Ktedonobacteraceae bacterium]|nr:hypothetical protein [Ktedonobacteraceae bacterium]